MFQTRSGLLGTPTTGLTGCFLANDLDGSNQHFAILIQGAVLLPGLAGVIGLPFVPRGYTSSKRTTRLQQTPCIMTRLRLAKAPMACFARCSRLNGAVRQALPEGTFQKTGFTFGCLGACYATLI